jgi:hypothetical protein
LRLVKEDPNREDVIAWSKLDKDLWLYLDIKVTRPHANSQLVGIGGVLVLIE